MTMSCDEVQVPAWNLLLSQRQDFLDNNLAQTPISSNYQGTTEMREDVVASAGGQVIKTRGHELGDLEDIEFFRENPQLEIDAAFRLVIDNPL